MLEALFTPQSVAVIGAARTPGKLGYGVLHNIIQYGYGGQIYPINPKADEILGLKAYSSVLDVPGPVELVVIVIPNRFVPQVMQECGEKGVKAAIIISAGFRESGTEGIKLERQVLDIARQYGIRVVGPNCLGIISTHSSSGHTTQTGRRGKVWKHRCWLARCLVTHRLTRRIRTRLRSGL